MQTKALRQEELLQASTWIRPDTQSSYKAATVLITENLHVICVHMRAKRMDGPTGEHQLWLQSGEIRVNHTFFLAFQCYLKLHFIINMYSKVPYWGSRGDTNVLFIVYMQES